MWRCYCWQSEVAMAPRRKKPRETRGQVSADDCTIPEPVPSKALPRLMLRRDPDHEVRHVRDYMKWQAPDEPVIHLEKVASEHVFSRRHDVWDVHTKKRRWWVITDPTNLYSQEHFPSLDYILSFHVGLMARVTAEEAKKAPEGPERERLIAPWRRWEQANESLDVGEESEDFQAVGMRCRECLLEFVQAASDPAMVAPGETAPKKGDFIHWSEVIARGIASGASAEEVRGHLKTIAKSTWQLVNWLTHAKNSTRAHGQLAIDSTSVVLTAFSTFLLRFESGTPERCPKCSSYQVRVDHRRSRGRGATAKTYSVCAKCGWETRVFGQDE